MSTDYFTARLAPLASAKVQELYGRGATKENYLLPEELLEGARECIAKVKASHNAANFLTSQAKEKILRLVPLLAAEEHDPFLVQSWQQLLEQTPWLQLRAAALEAVIELRFDLAAWEENELGSTNAQPEA